MARPRLSLSTRRVGLGLLFLACLVAPTASGFEATTGTLIAREPCPAFTSLRRQANPGQHQLVPGTSYAVQGRNRPGGEWLQLRLPGAAPEARWVEVSCGDLTIEDGRERGAGLLPFFDMDMQGAADPSPPPRPLGALDRAVLEVCGSWGSRPRRTAFLTMLDRPELQSDIRAIAARLGDPLIDQQAARSFKEALAQAWFGAGGFTHIFCGEPLPGGLGGLHFDGRYQELQALGLAGRLADTACARTEIRPPVYTIGVAYRLPGESRFREACVKGYAIDQDAAAIFVTVTRAYRAMLEARRAGMCLAEPNTGSHADYRIVIVLRDGAIRTAYPDASPACDGGGRPAECRCDG